MTTSDDFPAIPYPWQQVEWQRLQEQLAANKLPHALMLSGVPGIGKRRLAKALAQFLLCRAPVSGLPCGQCRDCELNRVETHPDLLWLAPEEAGKAIKVNQVRELTGFIGKTSQQGGYKLVVIDPAEAMNINASNALLKNLEEPSGNTLLILLTHSVSRLMATVCSRCQLLSLPLPPREQVLSWLEPLVTGQAEAGELLGHAGGAPLAALSLLEGDALEQRETMMTDLENLSQGQVSPLEVAARWSAYDTLDVSEYLLTWLHNLVCVLAGDTRTHHLPDSLRALLQYLPQVHLYRYLDKVLDAKKRLLSGSNPNKQLLLEELLMDWSALARVAGQTRRNGLT